MSRRKWIKPFGDRSKCGARQRFTCEQRGAVVRADIIRMSVQQKADSFCGCSYAASASSLHQFGNRWNCNVFSARESVAFFDQRWQFDIERAARIDVWSIDVIRNDAAIPWVNTGYHRRAVHHRGARINGVVISKRDALVRKLPKGRSILLAHKIRTHSI